MEHLVERLGIIERINDSVMPKVAYWLPDGNCAYANEPFRSWWGIPDGSKYRDRARFIAANLRAPAGDAGISYDAELEGDEPDGSRFRVTYTLDFQGDEFAGYIVRVDSVDSLGAPETFNEDAPDLPRQPKKPFSPVGYDPLGLGTVLETISESFCMVDSNWQIQYWNSSAERTTGQRKLDVLGKNMWDVFPQEKDSPLYANCTAAMQEGRHRSFEHNSTTGTWYYNSVHPNTDGGITIYFKDVTKRKRAEEQIREIKDNLHGLLNATDDLMWSVDSNLRLISANTAFSEYVETVKGYRYEAGEVVVLDKRTSERSASCEALYQRCLQGESFSSQNQSMGDRLTRYNPIFRSDGAVSGVACHSVDLSELRRLEREKTDSAERFRALIQNGSDLIFIFGRGYQLEYVSPSALSILGANLLERSQLIGLLHEQHSLSVLEAFKEKKHEKTFTLEPFRIKSASGKWLWIEAIVDNLLENPAVAGTVVNARDVTAIMEREAEHEALIKELVKTNSDLTQFSYITSHNLRAPLSNILGILGYVERSCLENETREVLAMLDASSKELSDTLDDLSRALLVRNGALPDTQEINIRECFDEANRKYLAIEEEIGVRLHLEFGASTARFCRLYLESIFSSLLSNAIKFRQPARTLEITLSTQTEPGGGVTLRFADNGMGLDTVRHGERLFGMYQRFHQGKEGKGMSLFMVQAQLQSFGGTILAESRLDEYTAFTIFLPG